RAGPGAMRAVGALARVRAGALPAEPGVLHDVLGIGAGAGDAVGHAEQARALPGELRVVDRRQGRVGGEPPHATAILVARWAARRPASAPLATAASLSSPVGPT